MSGISLLSFAGLGGVAYLAARSGALGPGAAKLAGDLRAKAAPLLGTLGAPIVPCPTAEELAGKLGTTVFRVRAGMAASGHDGCHLTLADLAGIPEVPDTVLVNGVPSHPNPQGPPASWNGSTTGGSPTWGGLTDSQVKAAFTAAAGGDPAKGQQLWEQQHAQEVQQRGF